MIVNGIGEEVEPVKDGSEIEETWLKCCICKGPFFDGVKHIPAPVKFKGRCCTACNLNVVVPARMNPYRKPKKGSYYEPMTPDDQSMLKWLQNNYPPYGKEDSKRA